MTSQYNGSLLERSIIDINAINFQFQDFVISTNFVGFLWKFIESFVFSMDNLCSNYFNLHFPAIFRMEQMKKVLNNCHSPLR